MPASLRDIKGNYIHAPKGRTLYPSLVQTMQREMHRNHFSLILSNTDPSHSRRSEKVKWVKCTFHHEPEQQVGIQFCLQTGAKLYWFA